MAPKLSPVEKLQAEVASLKAELQKKKDEETKKKAAEKKAEKKALDDAAKKKALDDAAEKKALDELKKKQDDETKKKAAEKKAEKKALDDAANKKALDDAEAKKASDDAEHKKAQEESEKQKALDDVEKLKAQTEKETEKKKKEEDPKKATTKKKRSRDSSSSSSSSSSDNEKRLARSWVDKQMRMLWEKVWGKKVGLLSLSGGCFVTSNSSLLGFLVRPEDQLSGEYACLAPRVAVLRANVVSAKTLESVLVAARGGVEVKVVEEIGFVLLELVALHLVRLEGQFNMHPLSTYLTLLFAPLSTLKGTKVADIGKIAGSSFVTKVMVGSGMETCESFTTPNSWRTVGGTGGTTPNSWRTVGGTGGAGVAGWVQQHGPPSLYQHNSGGSVLSLGPSASEMGEQRGGRGGRGGGGRGGRGKSCFNCGVEGHFARDCSLPSRGGRGGRGAQPSGVANVAAQVVAVPTTPSV